MRCGAKAAHLANRQSAHDRSSISRATADDLDVCGSAAEGFEFTAFRKNPFEIRCKDFSRMLRILLPCKAEHLGCEDDGSRCRIRISLGCVAILGSGKNRK